MIELRIEKNYPGFRLDVEAATDARVMGLVGPSGSGKTTMLNCIAGIETPDAGRIRLGGQTLFEAVPHRRRVLARHRGIGYVFQDNLVFPHMTVERNLRYARRTQERGIEFAEVVRVLELDSVLSRKAWSLSGGEAKRVALGRALLSAPRLLLLDEPLTGLDRRLAGRTLGYLHKVIETFRLPVIYVSHAVDDVCFLCERVWVLDSGRIVAQGRPQDVIEAYLGRGLPDADGLRNIFGARVETRSPASTSFELGNWRLVAATAGVGNEEQAVLSIRAADILLARDRPGRISARNVLPAKVIRIVPLENHRLILLDVGVPLYALVTPGAVESLALEPGVEAFAIIKATAVIVDAWI